MLTLNWIGQEAVVKHHKEVPIRLLEPVPELSCPKPHGGADSGNLIVQGDNLHALKALLPRYAGQVKCIYIDPPYNTGNEGWVYNDNVNSLEIRKLDASGISTARKNSSVPVGWTFRRSRAVSSSGCATSFVVRAVPSSCRKPMAASIQISSASSQVPKTSLGRSLPSNTKARTAGPRPRMAA